MRQTPPAPAHGSKCTASPFVRDPPRGCNEQVKDLIRRSARHKLSSHQRHCSPSYAPLCTIPPAMRRNLHRNTCVRHRGIDTGKLHVLPHLHRAHLSCNAMQCSEWRTPGGNPQTPLRLGFCAPSSGRHLEKRSKSQSIVCEKNVASHQSLIRGPPPGSFEALVVVSVQGLH